MSKILVTGGLGFIGSNLAEKCVEEGHEVTLLTRTNAKKRNIRGLKGKVNLILKDLVSMVIEEVGSGTIKAVSSFQASRKVRGIGDFYCDNTPFKKMGWKSKISIREGIKRVIDFYRKEEDIKSL